MRPSRTIAEALRECLAACDEDEVVARIEAGGAVPVELVSWSDFERDDGTTSLGAVLLAGAEIEQRARDAGLLVFCADKEVAPDCDALWLFIGASEAAVLDVLRAVLDEPP